MRVTGISLTEKSWRWTEIDDSALYNTSEKDPPGIHPITKMEESSANPKLLDSDVAVTHYAEADVWGLRIQCVGFPVK